MAQLEDNGLSVSGSSTCETQFLFPSNQELKEYKSSFKSFFSYSNDTVPYSSFKSAFTYSKSTFPSSFPEDSEIGNHKGESVGAKAIRFFTTYFSYFIIIALFPISLWICVKRVHALERLVVLRLGKLQPLQGPGYCIVIPCIDEWSRIDLQPKIYNITNEQILTADRAIIEISVSIKYSIGKAVQYITHLSNKDKPFENFVKHCILNVLSEYDQSSLENERERKSISVFIEAELNKITVRWGLEIISVEIPVIHVLQEGEPLHGPNVLINALKAVSSEWNHSVVKPSPVGGHKLLKDNENNDKNISSNSVGNCNSSEKNCFLDNITEWLEQEDYQKERNILPESFELKIYRNKDLLHVIYVLLQNGKASIFKDYPSPFCASCTIIMKEEDINDLINNKISIQQAYFAGKIQLKNI